MLIAVDSTVSRAQRHAKFGVMLKVFYLAKGLD